MKPKDKLLTKNVNNKSNSKLKNNSKQNNIKTVDKKKKLNINIFQDFFNNNNTGEAKYQKIKIKKNNKSVKDINPQKNVSNIVNRITQSNKDYEKTEHTIYKRPEYEKDHDYFSFNKYIKGKRKIRIITKKLSKYKNNKLYKKDADPPLIRTLNFKNEDENYDNDDEDNDEKENNDDDEIEQNENNNEEDSHKEGDIMFRTLYSANINKKGIIKKIKNRNKSVQYDNKNKEDKMEKKEKNNISDDKLNASIKNVNDNMSSKDLSSKDINKITIKIPKSLINKKNDKNSQLSSKYNMERTIDLYVIDGNEEISISPINKKEIDTNRNIFRKIVEENLKTNSKIKEKSLNKLTGFVLIRKNKGKKAYEIELEDNLEKINSIFKSKKIMINNETIQMISLNDILKYQSDIKSLNEKIKKLKIDISIEENNLEKEINKDKNKDNEITNLKSKIEELNEIIKKQKLELEKYANNSNLTENEKLKKSNQTIEKEKEKEQENEKEKEKENEKEKEKEKDNSTLANQVSSNSKKLLNTQIEYNQKNINDMKERIQKYKDELKKGPGQRQSCLGLENKYSNKSITKSKKYKNSVEIPKSKYIDFDKKKNEDNQKIENVQKDEAKPAIENTQKNENSQTTENNKKNETNQKIEDIPKNENQQADENKKESEDEDDTEYALNFKDDRNNPKSKKMRKAVNRFNQRFSRVIKEEKKLIKLKEKEEAEKEIKENEENEEDGEENNNEKDNNNAQNIENLNQTKEKEEKERKEAERLQREKEEAERIEKLNKEKIEKEELEKKKREEEERKEKERIKLDEERKRKEEEEKKKKEEEEKKKKEEEEKKKKEEEKKKKEEEEKKKKEEERKKKEEEEKKKKEEEEKKKMEEEEKEKKSKEEKRIMPNKIEGASKNKMQGNFAKMLADKLKMPPGGMRKVNIESPKRESNPPIIQNNVDVSKLLEDQPFKGRAARRKPTRKVFIEKNDEDN